jgi:hypothetical protein
MTNLAIDLFKMPRLSKDKIPYDTLILCVDRNSGWITAVPTLEKGLTGEKVAKLMLHQWRFFGVPQVIHSDRGPHFISTWWQTLCAGLGVRLSYSHAYHHQGNGRAERAGRQIQDLARKVHIETGMDWFDSLPQVVDRIHDSPGEGGYTPYQIIFGRDRPLGGVPYIPSRSSEDAQEFVKRVKEVEQAVAQTLNQKHQKQAEQVNKGRKDPPRFRTDDKVWYRRPEGTGEKTDSRWLGPGVVVEQVGQGSYRVQVEENRIIEAPIKFLKKYMEDPVGGGTPLFFHRRTERRALEKEGDEVEEVLGHKREGGRLWFLVGLVGEGEARWVEPSYFIQKVDGGWRKYCEKKGLKVDLVREGDELE